MFTFNTNAKYRMGGVYDNIRVSLLTPTIQVSTVGSFQAEFPDVFVKYILPLVSSDQVVQAWNLNPMQFWQNQLNFAVWCATAGCGVSARDHLASENLTGALYTFHVYYQVRRILEEIQAPLPQDQAWNAFDNPYDRRAYERICSEFNISPHANWRLQLHNHGLGQVYDYWTNNGYHPVGDGEYDSSRMSFTKKTINEVLHVDYIAQDPQANNAWTTFILDKSTGFTRPGVERLNDSIRTYVWAIIGAQTQTRTRILGAGTAFDAQKQFLVNVEDAISSPVDLPSAIKRYQDILQYASSKVDYVFGIGLYMAPSDMQLRINQIVGYNNEIIIATEHEELGVNSDVNTSASPAYIETGIVGSLPSETIVPLTPAVGINDHEDEKTALIVGSIAVGLITLWLLR